MRLSSFGTDVECHAQSFLLCSVGEKETPGALKIGQGCDQLSLLKVTSWGSGA